MNGASGKSAPCGWVDALSMTRAVRVCRSRVTVCHLAVFVLGRGAFVGPVVQNLKPALDGFHPPMCRSRISMMSTLSDRMIVSRSCLFIASSVKPPAARQVGLQLAFKNSHVADAAVARREQHWCP